VFDVRPFTPDRVGDLDDLFGSDGIADACWCMWFITRVVDFHAAGRAGNRAAFLGLAESSSAPLGLVAYDDARPVGWCAAGPRDRFARMLKAPTLKHRDRSEDSSAWLVPCFFVRKDARRTGVSRALLAAAVALAEQNGAPAVEGFPLAGSKTRSQGTDFNTGVEPLFTSCGFAPVHRPSANRVIMRRDLA
jgi:GNAT superfamily N-acetyltransferase